VRAHVCATVITRWTAARVTTLLQACMYEDYPEGCTRKNPEHFIEFAHPKRDARDAERARLMQAALEDDGGGVAVPHAVCHRRVSPCRRVVSSQTRKSRSRACTAPRVDATTRTTAGGSDTRPWSLRRCP
jgi:hypothetical protein